MIRTKFDPHAYVSSERTTKVARALDVSKLQKMTVVPLAALPRRTCATEIDLSRAVENPLFRMGKQKPHDRTSVQCVDNGAVQGDRVFRVGV